MPAKNASSAFTWYSKLKKPSWAPPGWLFGPVWSVLYVLIILSFGAVFLQAWQNQLPLLVALPFILNLIFNLMFSPIQFGMKNNLLAAVDILLVLATLLWSIIAIWPYAPWIAWINVPYLLWVCFATVLQLTVTFINRNKH